MSASGIKLHEIKRHTFISIMVAIICIFMGLQYWGAAETRQMAVVAIVAGVLVAIGAIYMLIQPMIILGEELIFFKTGNTDRKELAYSDIASWSLHGDKKQMILQLKNEEKATDAEKKNNRIIINYFNLDKKNQIALINQLNKKGVEQLVVIVEPERIKETKKKK
jgi:hypothetical protein